MLFLNNRLFISCQTVLTGNKPWTVSELQLGSCDTLVVTSCFVVAWNQIVCHKLRILFALWSTIWKKNAQKHSSLHLYCKSLMLYSWRGHFLLYPLASSLLCSLAWDFFFQHFPHFFFFYFDFDLHSFQLFTYSMLVIALVFMEIFSSSAE